MSFKDNLLKKIRINQLSRKVLTSIGPAESGLKIDKEAMRRLNLEGEYNEAQDYVRHPTLPLDCTPDGKVWHPSKGKAIVQVKCVDWMVWKNDWVVWSTSTEPSSPTNELSSSRLVSRPSFAAAVLRCPKWIENSEWSR